MTKVYAVADKVPEGCGYITAGKEYEVYADDGVIFRIVDDEDDGLRICLWQDCGHLKGGNWRRVER